MVARNNSEYSRQINIYEYEMENFMKSYAYFEVVGSVNSNFSKMHV